MSSAPCGVHSDTHPIDDNVLAHIGNTPLLRLRHIPAELKNPKVAIYGKAEWFNPGGSVKDRAALRIVEDAERSGELTRAKTLLDSTSGNTGIAYGMICAVKGYRCELVMPGNVSKERIRTVRAYGASVILSDPMEGSDGAQLLARRLYAENPEKYYLPCQYDNDSNWRAHYDTTGVEIIKQTGGRVTHFFAGVGTSGTLIGTGRRLKEFNERVQVYGVQPDCGFHGIEGLKHIPTAIRPGIYDESIPDETIHVATEPAYEMARRLAAEEGLFVGKSAGAVVHAAMQIARETDKGVFVVVLCDGGARYLSTSLFDD